MLKSLLGASALVTLMASASFAKIERSVDKSFAAEGVETVSIKSYGGHLEVRTVPGATSISVVAKQVINAKTNLAADEIAAQHRLEIIQSGKEIQARFGYGDKSGRWTGKGKQPMVVDFLVTAPTAVSVALETSGGDIEVGHLDGTLRAETRGGHVDVGAIKGTVYVSTSGGDISVASHQSEARLATSGGDIDVVESKGPLQASTSGGDISIGSASSRVRATTSGGDVKAHVTAPVSDSIFLESSGGDLVVTFARGAAFSLNASTSRGSVKSKNLSIQAKRGELGKSALEGDVNGGGQPVTLKTRGGDIRVDYK